jgi:hypothetical protein
MRPRPQPHRGRALLQAVRTFGRWDCINVRQRERAKEGRFAACASLLTSQASRRTPPNCGAFRVQPRGSPLRQTACWREPDSNPQSHPTASGDTSSSPSSRFAPDSLLEEGGFEPSRSLSRATRLGHICQGSNVAYDRDRSPFLQPNFPMPLERSYSEDTRGSVFLGRGEVSDAGPVATGVLGA